MIQIESMTTKQAIHFTTRLTLLTAFFAGLLVFEGGALLKVYEIAQLADGETQSILARNIPVYAIPVLSTVGALVWLFRLHLRTKRLILSRLPLEQR